MFAGAARRVVRWCLFKYALTGRSALALIAVALLAAPASARADATQLGLEDYFAYESTDTGFSTSLNVNVANGNVVWHSTPIVRKGRGLSMVANLTYNSQDHGAYQALGTGFSM